jgi:hypothetical protein
LRRTAIKDFDKLLPCSRGKAIVKSDRNFVCVSTLIESRHIDPCQNGVADRVEKFRQSTTAYCESGVVWPGKSLVQQLQGSALEFMWIQSYLPGLQAFLSLSNGQPGKHKCP